MFELVEMEDGEVMLVENSSGMGVSDKFFEMIFTLQRQNPDFYRAWVELAANYVFVGPTVGEA